MNMEELDGSPNKKDQLAACYSFVALEIYILSEAL